MALPVDPEGIQGNMFSLSTLRGGLDDTTPYIALAPDACVKAENVEFVDSTLGERRAGCTAIELSSDAADTALQAAVWMYRHLPVNDEAEAELWALFQSLTTSNTLLARRKVAAWETIVPDDAINVTIPNGHRLSAQTIHGKLFIAYKSAVDRLHVFDGASLRRVGLEQPDAPTAVDGGVGAFTTTRYYRVRYVVMDGDVVLRRSEPSEVLTFTPSGAGAYVSIVKPATISENETHWELEASFDNANFYRIDRQAVATPFTDEGITVGLGYAAFGPLSEDETAYTPIPSGKFLSADQDRLLIAGSWEEDAEASRVWWTPVYAAPGAGNDERIDLGVDPFLDLDGYEGGEITGMSRNVNGYIYVFKRSHIYKLVRGGDRLRAYDAYPLTKARGALPGSLIEAINQSGEPSLYFLDPSVGPCRVSKAGIQWCGRDIQTLWRRVNVNAAVPCHGVFYNDKRQLHYWLAVDGSDYPNLKIVLHVNEMRDTDEGGRRGWVTVAKDDRIATAHCSCMFSSNIDSTDDRTFTLVPFIGKERWTVDLTTIRDYIQRCDTGGTDAHTTGDTDSTYRAEIQTKPFALAGLMNHHEILHGVLLAKAADEPNGVVFVKAIRDFGKEEKIVSAELFVNNSTETHVIKQLDDLNFSELYTVQFALGDLDDNVDPPDEWELHKLQLKIGRGSQA